ncbi:MAG: anti-virulence regulator CigR family protein [Woeseiaceae bacterium]|nr:anti-virulence regulator CigR family protein [Woeseiaceae bacterium]
MRITTVLLTTVLLGLQGPAASADLEVSLRFTSKEVAVIRDFYHDHGIDKKGGKKGAKPMPPGIAKNLARGKRLPPGIAKQALPQSLLVKLPPVADGYERVIVAGKILLVEIATQVVHDILADIILD